MPGKGLEEDLGGVLGTGSRPAEGWCGAPDLRAWFALHAAGVFLFPWKQSSSGLKVLGIWFMETFGAGGGAVFSRGWGRAPLCLCSGQASASPTPRRSSDAAGRAEPELDTNVGPQSPGSPTLCCLPNWVFEVGL